MNISGRNVFMKYKFFINSIEKIIKVIPKFVRIKALSAVRRWRGYKGIIIRYLLIKSIAKECGENVVIMEDVYLYHPENLLLGSNISIHPMTYIQTGSSEIEIGDNVSIAHSTTIIAESHTYLDPLIPIKYQPMVSKQIKIGSNVWIGAKVTILCGVTIGEGTIIGAGAVVTHDIDKNSIAAGVPAKKIKYKYT